MAITAHARDWLCVECAEHPLNLDHDDAGPGEFECDWQRGVCVCPGCGTVVQIVPRPGQAAKVADGDGREHYCSRRVAAVLDQHGVPGMGRTLAQHARRPVIVDPPTPAKPSPPTSDRRTMM